MRTGITRLAFKVGLIALFALPVSASWPPVAPENFDGVRSPALPSGWAASQGVNVKGAPFWVTTPVSPHTAPNDAFSTAPDDILDNRLDTPLLPISTNTNAVRFWHSYNLTDGSDGAVLEISSPGINGGAFTDVTDPAVGGQFAGGGYNSTISTKFQSPIGGRMAWSGDSGGYVLTTIAFPFLSDPARLRFRLATDRAVPSAGWRIDTFSVVVTEGPTPTPSPPASPTPTATPVPTPCGGDPNMIVDSTFEAGAPWPAWTVQTSTNFGSPLCDTAACGTGGTAPSYSGSNWAWFGGASAPETATLGQSVSILAGGQATLSFAMRIGTVSAPITDVLNVRVDGTIVQSYPEPANAETSYRLRTIDLGAFADGGSHNILFEYIGNSIGGSSYALDNITLTKTLGCSTPTPSPTVTPTATASATPTPTPSPTLPPTPSPTPTATPSPTPAQALNISTRLRVETGERVMIGGFFVTGTAPKKVAIRGVGPSLANFGLVDLLADPTLELRGSSGVLLQQNDNWQDDPEQAAQLTALGLALQNPSESGMIATLDPGAYTAIIAGKNQASGVALVEIYDVDAAAASRLANISTRGFVQTGDNVMIGGFILGSGSGSATVAVRGIGPSLGQLGLSNVLADPTLELRDGNGTVVFANDNWQDDPVLAAQLTAQGLAPQSPLESGIVATLPPGLFTAILAGKNGGVGLGLVEIFGGLQASTFTVTSTADSGAGSLRNAIAAARDGDLIDVGLNGQTITLTSSELLIDKNITIWGSVTVKRSTADGTPAFRIFHITPGHTVTLFGLTISNGFADMNNPSGGGMFNDQSTLTLFNCAVEDNYSAVGSGGGICNSGSSANLTVAYSTVTGNFMEVEPVFICCGGGFGAGIYSDGTLAIAHSTVSGNGIGYLQNDFAGDGGGIYSSGGAVTISYSSVSGNFANRVAGGIFNRGTLEITNSTINFNESIRSGGGVYNEGTLAIDNSTFTGNMSAELSTQGGGISNHATTTILRTTFSENSAGGDGGNIFNSGAIQIGNTILKAQSGGGNIFSQGGASTVTSLGYNLSSDNGGGFLTATGDQINTNPMLGPLQDNGGTTFTHALLTGSPAINAGDPNFTPPPIYDQRGPGCDRVGGGRIDVGSFELQVQP